MIIEYLQPNPSIWDGLAVVLRAASYAASLGAAGLAMFAVCFGARLTPLEGAQICRWIGASVALGVCLIMLGLLLQAQILSAGSIANPDIWEALLRSRLGDAYLLRILGLSLLLPLALRLGIGPALAGAGILFVIGSYAAMGHSTLFMPRQELAVLVVLHLGCVAFWFGSLAPLYWVVKRDDRDAGLLVADWSRVAMIVVAVMTASGLIAAALLLRQPEQLLRSWYGNAMIVKVALVAVLMGFAVVNKLLLSPRLGFGERHISKALARSIMVEAAVFLIVLYAASEMISVHPTDLGHRIKG